jgi:hypothetical protein
MADIPKIGTNVDFSNANNGPTFYLLSNSGTTLYGSLVLIQGMTFTHNSKSFTLEGRGTHSITSAGKSFYSVTFNAYGGTYSTIDGLTASSSFTLLTGTFNANDQNTSTFSLVTTSGSTINLGYGTWTLTATMGIALQIVSGTIVNCGQSTITNNYTSTNTLQFLFGGQTFYNFTLTGSRIVGADVISNNDGTTFNNLTINKIASNTGYIGISTNITVNGVFTIACPNRIRGVGGKTISLGSNSSLIAVGSAGNLIDWNVVSGTTPWLITKSSGVVACDWLNLGYSTATGTFYAGANSNNLGNNSGWIFTGPPALSSGNMFELFD